MEFQGNYAKEHRDAQLKEYDEGIKAASSGRKKYLQFEKKVYSIFNSDMMCKAGFGPYDPRDYNSAYTGEVKYEVAPIHPDPPAWAVAIKDKVLVASAKVIGDALEITGGLTMKVVDPMAAGYNKFKTWATKRKKKKEESESADGGA